MLTNYVRLLEVLFGDGCPHMQWVLRLRDALDSHERLLENRITPILMINLLWKVHQDSHQFFGELLPRSTLRATVEALVDDVHIITTLTCPVTDFLGMPTQPHRSDRRDPGAPGKLPPAVKSNPPRTHPFHPSVPQR